MTIASDLAERIAGVTYESLPPEAVHWAKVAILDAIGCTLAGSVEPCTHIIDRVTTGGASDGPCLIFGTGRRVRPLDAALINGTASHALDYDDVSGTMGGHPSVPLVPTLFALADSRPVDGRAFITAFVTGFEVETRIGRGVNLHHYEKGWHPTATLGVFGATAAACQIMGLPADRIAVALGLATSFAASIKANFGTMTKPLHVGHCARSGLLAALLAADGFTANPGAFEHKQGFLMVFNGAGTFNVEAITKDWAAPWDLVDPGVGIKQYPCCGSTHSPVDAMLMLVREHDVKPEQVELIESWTHPRRLAHTDRPQPTTELEGKFSVQYCMSRALLSRSVKLEHFTDAAIHEPAVRALLQRVRSLPYPEETRNTVDPIGTDVRVTLKDGRVLTQHLRQARGRGTADPLPAELLEAKFLDCASIALPEAAAQRLLASVRGLENVQAVSSVTQAMEV